MSQLELIKSIEQQRISPLAVEKGKSGLELAGEWDDDKRREAVKQNQLESTSEPLTYDDSLEYLKTYEKAFMDATLELQQNEEKRGELLETARKIDLDLELAKFNSPQPVMRLLDEVESHLQSLARMKEEGEGDTGIHESEMEDLRRVRDSLFTKYEQIPPSETARSFESVYGGLTGEAPAPHLRNSVKNRENSTSSEELDSVKPQLNEVLAWTDQALGGTEVTQQFKKIFGAANALSAEVTTAMSDKLFDLYQQYTQDQLSSLEYKYKINDLFNTYHEELNLRTAA